MPFQNRCRRPQRRGRIHLPQAFNIIRGAVHGLELRQTLQVRMQVYIFGASGLLSAFAEHVQQYDVHDVRPLIAGDHELPASDTTRGE